MCQLRYFKRKIDLKLRIIFFHAFRNLILACLIWFSLSYFIVIVLLSFFEMTARATLSCRLRPTAVHILCSCRLLFASFRLFPQLFPLLPIRTCTCYLRRRGLASYLVDNFINNAVFECFLGSDKNITVRF